MDAPFIDPDAIRRQAWGGAFTRGTQYFHDGAVRRVEWDAASRTISGDVAGSRAQRYRSVVRLKAVSDRIDTTWCSCPMEADCKHVVATLLAANASRLADTPGPSMPGRTVPGRMPGIPAPAGGPPAAHAGPKQPTWR
ncbi:MAG TPA: SWIM zinc finger family protein, partial [Microbacterium sp.]|uniref:SWIM zinc finger family protein n=1 Tax=Microbacterium sp. TaxID=51671 RepID=UPI002B488BD2